jgi:hypothetical protein
MGHTRNMDLLYSCTAYREACTPCRVLPPTAGMNSVQHPAQQSTQQGTQTVRPPTYNNTDCARVACAQCRTHLSSTICNISKALRALHHPMDKQVLSEVLCWCVTP